MAGMTLEEFMACERLTGELTTLICIEYLGLSISRQGFLQRIETEVHV